MVYHILCYSLTTLLTALFLGCTSRKKKGSVRAGNGSDGIESRPLAELEECDDSGGACKHCGDKKRERDATGSKDFIDGSLNRGRRRPSKNREKNCKRKHISARREDYAKEKNWSGEVMKISDDSDSMAKRKNHVARDAHQYSNESSRSGRRPLGALSDDEQPSESARIKRGTYEKYGSRDTTDYKSREPTGGYGKRNRKKDRRQPGEALGGTTDLMQSRNTTNDIQMSADRITRSSDANRTSRKEVLRSIEHMHSNERLNSKQSFLQPEKGNKSIRAPDDDQSVSEMKRETKNKTLEDQTNGGDRVLHTSYDVIKEKDKREKRRRSRKKSCGVNDEKGYKRGGESDLPRKKRGDKAHGRLERIPEVLEYSDSKDDPREPVHSRPQRKQHPKQSKKPRKRSSKKKEKSRKEKKANPDRMKSIEHMNSNFNLLSKEQMKEGEPAKLFENARLICDKNGYCELRQLNNLGEKFNEAALQKVSVTTNEHEISKKGEKKKKEKETEQKEEKEQVAETCPDEDDKANYFMIVDPPSSNRAIRQDQVAEELSPNGYIDLWKDGEVKEIPRRGSK